MTAVAPAVPLRPLRRLRPLRPLRLLCRAPGSLSTASGASSFRAATTASRCPAARVLLHRVGRDAQGPVDSVPDRRRAASASASAPTPPALYLLSARYGGIEYFSTPVHTNPGRARHDACAWSSTTPRAPRPIAVEARHIVVPRPGEDGARAVLDLIVLRNDGRLARVSARRARGRPGPWRCRREPATCRWARATSRPTRSCREGDTVKVLAPLAPGQKQLSLEYAVVAAGRDRSTFDVGSAGGSAQRAGRGGGSAGRRRRRSRWPTARSSRAGASAAGRGRPCRRAAPSR